MKRTTIRLAALTAALCTLALGTLWVQQKTSNARDAALDRICACLLSEMAEHTAALNDALDTRDAALIRFRTEMLSADAARLAALRPHVHVSSADALRRTADAASVFYAALARQIGETVSDADAVFWKACVAQAGMHIADLACAISDADPQSKFPDFRAAAELEVLADAFAPDPVRAALLDGSARPTHTYDKETPVTAAKARASLKGVLGRTATLLGDAYTDEDGGVYLFSCRNGYASVSVHGGHVLTLLLFPRTAQSDSAYVTRALTEQDLDTIAADVLGDAGVSVSGEASVSEKHGIRYYSFSVPGGTVTVGLRITDGALRILDTQAFYISKAQ